MECEAFSREMVTAVTELVAQQKSLVSEVRTLATLHREVIRWLLFVVCVIALGKEAGGVIDRLVGVRSAEAAVSAQGH